MSGKRTKHLILILSILFPLIIAATPLCRANNFPDASTLDQSYVLKNNRQFFIGTADLYWSAQIPKRKP
jgi:hypothetical protein